MSHTDTDVSQLKINRGAYAVLQQNLDGIGENELIIATDKGVPVPTADDSGKVISVNSSGEYELTTASSGMTNPMTTAGDIIYGGTSGAPTRLAKGSAGQVLTMNSGATAPTWVTPSDGGGITEISTQYIRITDLASGVYKLTYSGTKYIYYNGSTSTTTHTVTGSSGAVVLTVSRYSTNYWHWWYINGSTSYATLYYGYTSSSSGSTNSKSINSLYTGTPSNYYPTRSYTSGLQISSYSGSSVCQLYVPYAKYNQYGVVKPAYSTSGTASLTTSSTSYSNSPTINARTTDSDRYYAVESDSAGRLFINVPWTERVIYHESQNYGECYTINAPNNDYSIQIGDSGFTVDTGVPGDQEPANLLLVNSSDIQYQGTSLLNTTIYKHELNMGGGKIVYLYNFSSTAITTWNGLVEAIKDCLTTVRKGNSTGQPTTALNNKILAGNASAYTVSYLNTSGSLVTETFSSSFTDTVSRA